MARWVVGPDGHGGEPVTFDTFEEAAGALLAALGRVMDKAANGRAAELEQAIAKVEAAVRPREFSFTIGRRALLFIEDLTPSRCDRGRCG